MCSNSIRRNVSTLCTEHLLKVISVRSVRIKLFHYTPAVEQTEPQGDAMENWEQVHRLRKGLLTPATLAKHDGQHCQVRPPSFLPLSFTFPVCLSPASGGSISPVSLLTPSGEPGHVKLASINHSALPAGETEGGFGKAEMEGWVQRKEGGWSIAMSAPSCTLYFLSSHILVSHSLRS